PETTRDIYVQLFEKIKSQMPEGSLDGLNLLTESRDVQYDNFNKMYVMGMNKKGTRVLRPPSEMVIFTGNPHTAKKILESNQAKLHEDAVRLGFAPFKQVFLGFGAGINPIVVVPSAKTQIQKAVYSALEPVRINNGQDCLAADFIAVDKRVADSFIQTLMSEISQLQPGSNKDVHAGYTPLTMNKNFDQLKAYREKYSAYLLNPEAVLDENTRLVSPHVFVFPYSMFKNVEIREHFAPFFTVFKFEGDQQLEKIMRDERVQDKTMYASVLGGPRASPDLDSAIQILRQTRHSVIVNDSLFGDLHANMPYGGRGASTSLVVNTSYDPQAGIQSAMGHRPKLVSHEAYTAFGKPTSKFRPSLLPRSYFEQELYHLMKAAEKNPLNLEFTSSEWKRLKDPFLGARPRGLVALQELIQKEGFHIVVDQGHISKSDAAEFKEFFGAEALVAPVNSMTPKIVPGVLFHPSSVGQAVKVLNRARGSANPHLGWGNLHGIFDSNKYAEYILTEAVKPGIMAPTETLKALKNAGVLS
ncbi:MAG: aldehyde dehydrogenase family protein, partial [Bdellovibrionales bacterium]